MSKKYAALGNFIYCKYYQQDPHVLDACRNGNFVEVSELFHPWSESSPVNKVLEEWKNI